MDLAQILSSLEEISANSGTCSFEDEAIGLELPNVSSALRTLTEKPLVLIDIKDDKLVPVEETMKWLTSQLKTVSVASIVGPTSLGKSFLLNHFVHNNLQSTGFPSEDDLSGTTRGIWVWGLENPFKDNEIILLVDTEGQLDVERNEKSDMKITLLALLLSSVIIYNVDKKIGNDLIQQLWSLASCAQQIHYNSDVAAASHGHISEHLPSLIVLIRDFQSELEFDGSQVTPDTYLETCLKENIKLAEWDRVVDPMRKVINEMFPKGKRFGRVLPYPFANYQEDLALPEGVPTFEAGLVELRLLTLMLSQFKTLSSNGAMNGRYFANLINSYVAILNGGDSINIQPTHDLISKQEKKKIFQEGMETYARLIKNLNYPMDYKDVIAEHSRISSILMEDILTNVVFDDSASFSRSFQMILAQLFHTLVTKNEEESAKFCRERLQQFYGDIEQKVRGRVYSRPNGYNQYKADMEALKDQYERTPNKGPKDDSVLLQFLSEKEVEQSLILKADNQITELKMKEEENRSKVEEIRMEEKQERRKNVERDQQLEDLRQEMKKMQKLIEEEQTHRHRKHEEEMKEQKKRMEDYEEKIKELQNNPWNKILEIIITVLEVVPLAQILKKP